MSKQPGKARIQAVADGQFDMAADGITITEDRAESWPFPMGISTSISVCSCASTKIAFANMDEFAADDSLIIGTQTGTTNFETASNILPEDRIPGI